MLLDIALERVHSEVDLLVLFFGGGESGLSKIGFEEEKFVLHGLDAVEVSFSLFLREFVELVQQQTQIIYALAYPVQDCFGLEHLNNSCYNQCSPRIYFGKFLRYDMV